MKRCMAIIIIESLTSASCDQDLQWYLEWCQLDHLDQVFCCSKCMRNWLTRASNEEKAYKEVNCLRFPIVLGIVPLKLSRAPAFGAGLRRKQKAESRASGSGASL
jgi:hypothetical protein